VLLPAPVFTPSTAITGLDDSRIKPDAFEKIKKYEELERKLLEEYIEKLKKSQQQVNYQFTTESLAF
jgi:Txe/YoeB family toxin of Txe-Axe toxin-antitoxin module